MRPTWRWFASWRWPAAAIIAASRRPSRTCRRWEGSWWKERDNARVRTCLRRAVGRVFQLVRLSGTSQKLAYPCNQRDYDAIPKLMTFLHPWAILIGVAAAAGPVLIHWLTRPRPVRMPLSTLRFVREAVRQRRSWHRLRDLVLLDVADAGRAVDRPGRGPAAMGAAAASLRSPGRRRRARGGPRRQPEHGRPRGRRRADRAGADRRRQLSPLPAGPGGQPDSGRRAAAGRVRRRRRPTSTPCATNWPAAAPCRSGWTSIGRWTWPPACWRPTRRAIIAGGSWSW